MSRKVCWVDRYLCVCKPNGHRQRIHADRALTVSWALLHRRHFGGLCEKASSEMEGRKAPVSVV